MTDLTALLERAGIDAVSVVAAGDGSAAKDAVSGARIDETESVFTLPLTRANGDEVDLFIAQVGDWIHFAISPLLPRWHDAASSPSCADLLRLNSRLRLARIAIDTDGDLALLLDLPAADATPALLDRAIVVLQAYVHQFS